MKVRNVIGAVRDQSLRDFVVTGNAWGILSRRSHVTFSGTAKVGTSKATADKIARHMTASKGVPYESYKCMFCDDYHVGRNRS